MLTAPVEPDPKAWLNPDRRKLIEDQMKDVHHLLRQAGLWRATLSYWVRWQASLEAGWSKKDEQECIDKLLEKWHNQNQGEGNKELRALDDLTLRKKLGCSGSGTLEQRTMGTSARFTISKDEERTG